MVMDPEDPETFTWLEVPASCVTPELLMVPAEIEMPVPAVSLEARVVELVMSYKKLKALVREFDPMVRPAKVGVALV